jgi:cell division protein FtsQ
VLVRRWVALLIVLGVFVLGLAVWFTPLLGVRDVAVSGTQALSTDQVIAAADVTSGTPMVRLSTAAVAARVAKLPRVASADVFREWPGTVRIVVTERAATSVLTERDGVHLVDATGFDFATVPVGSPIPPGLPKLLLPAASPADPRTQAVEAVLAALPVPLRAQVVSIGANTPGGVRFALTNGKTVVWGGAEDSDRKAAVLAVLLTRPGTTYDVSSPDLPTVS